MRARLGLGIAATAAVLLSGCAAGQHAATANELPGIDGTEADAGTMAVRAIAFAPPSGDSYSKGTDVPLEFVLVNTGRVEDKLLSVSSPNFAGPTSTTLAVEPGTATRVGIQTGDPEVSLSGLAKAPGGATGLFPGASDRRTGRRAGPRPSDRYRRT